MDVTVEPEVLKNCFKFGHVLYHNLSIVYNQNTSMVILWNKFQIFVHENRNLQNLAKLLIPEFQIHQLILTENYILCLDMSGHIHTISLKFKKSAQKRTRNCFQSRERNVKCCFLNLQNALIIKYVGNEIFLCLHKIDADFTLDKKIKLTYSSQWPLPEPVLGKCLLVCHNINEEEFDRIKQIYKARIMPEDSKVVIISFDRLTMFSCLFSHHMDEEVVPLIKLHTCPSEICSIDVLEDLTILTSLKSGTLIQFDLKNSAKEPNVTHLTVAIDKCINMKDTFIYSDGLTLWKAHKHLTDDITFQQFIFKLVKDFVVCGDQLICTTYSNLIYILHIDDEAAYVKSLSTDEYCKAETVFTNTEYLYKTLEEIELNNDLVKKIKEEGNYLTVLALSYRKDIMDTIVQQKVKVYEKYEDVCLEHRDLLLTDHMEEYFDKEAYLFLIKISTKVLQQMFSNIISNLFSDLQLHFSYFLDMKLIKTTSLKLNENLKMLHLLTSLKVKNCDISEINIVIRLISSLPGSHDRKQLLWTCLYEKHISLKSEHFIKPDTTSAQIINLADTKDNLEQLIAKVEHNRHKHLFRFVDASSHYIEGTDWSMYLKLPTNYRDLFVESQIIKEHLNPITANFLIRQYTSQEFLESTSEFFLQIGKEKVKVQLNMDFSFPLLQVSSQNVLLAFNIRNLFSKLIYNDFGNLDCTAKEYVNHVLYSVNENMQRDIKACIKERRPIELFKAVADNFEKNVIGSLPI